MDDREEDLEGFEARNKRDKEKIFERYEIETRLLIFLRRIWHYCSSLRFDVPSN